MPSHPTATKKSKHEDRLKKALDLKFNKQFIDAEKILKKIHKEDPKNEDALMALAEIQGDTGRHEIALRSLAKLVKINPNLSVAWRHMGFIELYVKNDMNRAVDFLTRALNLNQTDPEIYRMMGYLSLQLNQFDDAIELLEIGLQLSPSHPETLSYLGMAYVRQRRFEEGKEKVIQALKLKPENPNILMNAMKADELLDLDEEKKGVIEKAMQIQIKNPKVSDFIRMYKINQHIENKDHDAALEILEDIDDSTTKQATAKYFHLGKIYRSKGEYDKSFDYLKKANELQSSEPAARKYRKENLLNNLKYEMDTLDKDFVERLEARIHVNDIPRPYKDPVFLVGFPRSGTTLSGQVLDNHPDVITADELGGLDQVRIHFHQKYKKRVPADLPDLTKEELKYMRELYNEKQAGEPLKYKDKTYVDKMPLNSIHTTLMHTIFPNAKILFVRRHPLDSVLSGYMQHFALNSAMIHFNDIEDMARLYVKIMEVWEHQKDMLPIDYYEFKYEDLVADFDGEAKKILEFVGLDWNESVRDFHKNQSGGDGPKTLTPSRTQVNKGIYKGAQNRWKKYEEHLKPAIDILGDTIEKLGYEV